MVETHITLYGSSSERFEEIQRDLEEKRGCEVSNAEVARRLFEEYPDHPTIER